MAWRKEYNNLRPPLEGKMVKFAAAIALAATRPPVPTMPSSPVTLVLAECIEEIEEGKGFSVGRSTKFGRPLALPEYPDRLRLDALTNWKTL